MRPRRLEPKFRFIIGGIDDGNITLCWLERQRSAFLVTQKTRLKPWSVRVLLPNARGFYPDFIVGVRDRPRPDHALLADPKERWEQADEVPKISAEHPAYGRAVILGKGAAGQWMVVNVDGADRPYLDVPFQIVDAAAYE